MNLSNEDNREDANNEHSRNTIILENEILLMKLNAEFGAQIFLPETRVDPEIENHFLRSVYDFEKNASAGRERETIYKIIGESSFPEEATLSDEEVSKQLDLLSDLLYQHKIVLDTLAEYPDRTLYRFITTELFKVEMDLLGGSDCYMHLCYEDFYPNHDYDLRQATRYFVNFIIDDLSVVPQNGLYTRVRTTSGILVGYKEAVTIIQASRSEFTSLKLSALKIVEVAVIENIGFVRFEINYGGILPDGGTIEVKGEGQLEFVYSDELWLVSFLKFPGIII